MADQLTCRLECKKGMEHETQQSLLVSLHLNSVEQAENVLRGVLLCCFEHKLGREQVCGPEKLYGNINVPNTLQLVRVSFVDNSMFLLCMLRASSHHNPSDFRSKFRSSLLG